MKTGFTQVAFMLLYAASLVRCEATYSLVVPKQAHTGRSLDCVLTVFYSGPADVQVQIFDSNKRALPASTKSIGGDGVITKISENIPAEWTAGKYTLNVHNNKFNASVEFEVVSVPYAILVQTDKPIYKPSQTVNIRVAVIDDNLVPMNETVNVLIADAEGNKLKLWVKEQTSMGLAQFSLPLSDRPPLGDWKITVSTDVVEQEKTIKIDEYVLPRFEVSVELPSYILKNASSVTCTVTAQYTFGEDVVGKMVITFKTVDGALTKTGISIDGKVSVTLDLKEIQSIGLSTGAFTATAEVYEPLSGKTLNGSSSADIVVSNYEISFMDINSKTYRPGQKYTAYYEVSHPDGKRIKGESIVLVVTLRVGSGTNVALTSRQAVPDNGIVTAEFDLPPGTSYIESLKAELILGNGETMKGPTTYLTKFATINSKIFLHMSSNIRTVPSVGDSAIIDIASSESSGKYTYMVVARGRIIASGTGTLTSGSSRFTLPITQDFTPQAYVVITAVNSGELLADSFSFNVNGAFRNQVNLEFTDTSMAAIEQAKPGQDIKVKVETKAGSTVCLLSVDKSVLLLGSGNDISEAQILTELMTMVKVSTSCKDRGSGDVVPFRFFGFPTFGGKSSEDIFSMAGVQIVTDAVLKPCRDDVIMMFDDAFKLPQEAAIPVADSLPVDNSQSVKRRVHFPETWLWDLTFSKDASLVLDKTVPDTITSWVTTALSMHPQHGISVTSDSVQLVVKKPFFITAILPYSAVKGEELELKILLNNYGDADDSCTITIEGSRQYDSKIGENDIYMPGKSLVLGSKKVAKGGGAATVSWFKPRVIGTIKLKASARCTSGANDAFERDVLVKPPGFPQEICDSEFIQIEKNGDPVTISFNTSVPGNYVEDSKRVEVQATGDVMGPSIEGLERLVRVPHGCGEQNMITFTPNIVVRSYLDSIGQSDVDINAKTTRNMETGYQRELTYKHTDGSFSAFGNSDPSGSTWLTAFVMKCFRQAGEFVDIDEKVLTTAKTWLLNQKSDSTKGMFNEPGKVCHSEMQGGSSGGITLTAFVVIAMLEGVADPSASISSLSATISYLENSLPKVQSNPYQLAIITYSLQLAQSNKVDSFLTKLEALQKESAGMIWWELPKKEADTGIDGMDLRLVYRRGGPSSVEMVSYALLTYIARKELIKAKPIARWLTKNRGSNGGFYSTQDTVLGLQALADYAGLVISKSTSLQIDFETNNGANFSHAITLQNAIITKKSVFDPSEGVNAVTVKVSGEGSAIVTACTSYNVRTIPLKPTTVVTTDVTENEANSTKTKLTVCTSYVGDGDSGMGLTEVIMPTGFSASVDEVEKKSGDLARTESTSGGIAVYWNTLTRENSCVIVNLVRDSVVKDMQNSYVTGSQYYNTESGSRAFFNPLSARLVTTDQNGNGNGPAGSAQAIRAAFAMILLALITHMLS